MNEDLLRKTLLWLRCENDVQQNVEEMPWGQKRRIDHDLSGGLRALISLLQSDEPLPRSLRHEIADALDPYENSRLQIIQRPGRKSGRPAATDTVAGTVRHAYEVHVRPAKQEAARKKVERRRPIPAVGLPTQKATASEVAGEMGETRSTFHRKNKAAKAMKVRDE